MSLLHNDSDPSEFSEYEHELDFDYFDEDEELKEIISSSSFFEEEVFDAPSVDSTGLNQNEYDEDEEENYDEI